MVLNEQNLKKRWNSRCGTAFIITIPLRNILCGLRLKNAGPAGTGRTMQR